uniref:Uncharacterized protein n=1 Tax=Rhizophora mucronata TaxID=61149 RepID=A0A2P2Q9K6_RHIMU
MRQNLWCSKMLSALLGYIYFSWQFSQMHKLNFPIFRKVGAHSRCP